MGNESGNDGTAQNQKGAQPRFSIRKQDVHGRSGVFSKSGSL
jgi:hypothetical protein